MISSDKNTFTIASAARHAIGGILITNLMNDIITKMKKFEDMYGSGTADEHVAYVLSFVIPREIN